TVRTNPAHEEYICLARTRNNLRENLPPASYDDLLAIAEQAYLKSTSRSEWCRRILELIDEKSDVQNCVRKSELLSAVMAVNSKYADLDGLFPQRGWTPEDTLLLKRAEQAINQTLGWLEQTVLADFIPKGRLTPEEAKRFIQAARCYLNDMVHCGQTDLIPQYFRENLPPGTHARYLRDYKYLFETAINKAVAEFRRRLGPESTNE
ncbi:MAG: hypothetical protein AB1744_16100, partial [Candidatus Zixiibacteriota bacterium]